MSLLDHSSVLEGLKKIAGVPALRKDDWKVGVVGRKLPLSAVPTVDIIRMPIAPPFYVFLHEVHAQRASGSMRGRVARAAVPHSLVMKN